MTGFAKIHSPWEMAMIGLKWDSKGSVGVKEMRLGERQSRLGSCIDF